MELRIFSNSSLSVISQIVAKSNSIADSGEPVFLLVFSDITETGINNLLLSSLGKKLSNHIPSL